MSTMAKKIVHFWRLLYDFGAHIQSPTLLCDINQIANNPLFQEWITHIEIDAHFVRRHVLAAPASLPHVFSLSRWQITLPKFTPLSGFCC